MAHGIYRQLKAHGRFIICTSLLIALTNAGSLDSIHSLTNFFKLKSKNITYPFIQKKTLTANTTLFWQQLKKEFKLTHYPKKYVVKQQINHFLQRPYQLSQTLQRSAPYLHYVFEQVKQRHLPAELALLPFIESTYNPLARHKVSKAAGLWQLTPRTAQNFGVRQDAIFDGKHDIHTSTNAALDYLTYLNQLFGGDWLLTLAAYITGEGNVKKAIRYNKDRYRSTTFWNLPLSSDTIAYVPKLLALSTIINNAKQYGLNLPTIHTQPYLEKVTIKPGITVIHAANLANLSIDRVKQLNPGFKQLRFVSKQPYHLLLPPIHARMLRKNMANAALQPKGLQLLYHPIKSGDNLLSIAKRHGITTKQLCLWNGLKPSDKLPTKKRLLIIKIPLLIPHTEKPS